MIQTTDFSKWLRILLAEIFGVERATGDDALTADELYAVWLGAGLATQVGLALMEQPERFIRAAVPTA